MYYIKKSFLNFLLILQNLFKKKRSNSANAAGGGNSSVNSAATIQINSKNEDVKKEVERISTKIVKKYFGDIDKTIAILEKRGIKVYRTRFAVKILKNINEKQGFLTPLKGFKAFYLNFFISLLCDKKLSFKMNTPSMFVFSGTPIDKYFLASQVYRFVAYRKKLPGFEYSVQDKFKKIYRNPNTKNFNSLTAGDIFALKEAIARDVESVDFAVKLNAETELLQKIDNLKAKNSAE